MNIKCCVCKVSKNIDDLAIRTESGLHHCLEDFCVRGYKILQRLKNAMTVEGFEGLRKEFKGFL